MSRVFVSGPGDRGSIPGRVIPKTQKMVLDAALLNTQHYKVRIKGKMAQSREWSSAPLHLSSVAIEKELSGHPRLRLQTLLYLDECVGPITITSYIRAGVHWDHIHQSTSESAIFKGFIIYAFALLKNSFTWR